MKNTVVTMRFLEYGKPAPKNSGFKGVITGEAVFGRKGWMSYTSRRDAVDPTRDHEKGNADESLFGYSGREAAEKGYTMSSYGFLDSDEKRNVFRDQCRNAFAKEGDLIWDVVISLPDYEEAEKCGLKDQQNYGAFINSTLIRFFKRIDMDPMNILWWEDYHSNTEHPHMHVCFLEKKQTRDRGRFSAKELRILKGCIGRELLEREKQQEKIGTYADPLIQKDKERAEIIATMKKVDLDQLSGMEDLLKYLPRKGRLQYGAYQIAPFRPLIDQITDSLLASDTLKDSYRNYLDLLEKMEKDLDEKAGSHAATIRAAEMERLHADVGNIILKYIKEIRLSNKDIKTGYGFLEDQLKESEGSAEVKYTKVSIREWQNYRSVRDAFYQAAGMPSGSERKEKVASALRAMSNLAENTNSDPIRGLLAHRLALTYLYGRGVGKDIDQAKAYAEMAVDAGNDRAFAVLAKVHFAKGEHAEGMAALFQGKLKEDPSATYMWGLQLISDKHCPRDRNAGMEAVTASAMMGCIQAMNYIQTHQNSSFSKTAEGTITQKIKSGVNGRYSSLGKSSGGEIAYFLNNSDRLHVFSGQLEREIDTYLNGTKIVAQKN